jgi:hypothetical protein
MESKYDTQTTLIEIIAIAFREMLVTKSRYFRDKVKSMIITTKGISVQKNVFTKQSKSGKEN